MMFPADMQSIREAVIKYLLAFCWLHWDVKNELILFYLASFHSTACGFDILYLQIRYSMLLVSIGILL